jgi:hypothetical protein
MMELRNGPRMERERGVTAAIGHGSNPGVQE